MRNALITQIEQNKYSPAHLFHELERNSDGCSAAYHALEEAAEGLGWPSDCRSWKCSLLVLLGHEIGGIFDPYKRDSAAQELFDVAARNGITKRELMMLMVSAGDLRKILEGSK